MKTKSQQLEFFMAIAKAQTVLSRRFDARLGGLGFSEFLILYHLGESRDEKLRRSELADMLGLTPSGITRLLAPMEKIGLVKRLTDPNDARIAYVSLAPGGYTKLSEALERAELLSDDLFSSANLKVSESIILSLHDITKSAHYGAVNVRTDSQL